MTLAEERWTETRIDRSSSDLDRAARRENFPVASRLLPSGIRGKVVAFYRFARAADDIADDPDTTPEAKLARLDDFARGLAGDDGAGPAAALRHALHDGRDAPDAVALAAAGDLLVAFRRDARGIACADWADLMSYCDASAVPVGRFLLAVHGENAATHGPSDALCAALQVLNHLQDLGPDHRALDRRYLPGDWMAAEGAADADLGRPFLTPALGRVVARTLDASDVLLTRAAPLPGLVAARGLRLQAAATLALARRLQARLRRGDPLTRRVALRRTDFALAGLSCLRFVP
ncbi:squalene/phytoene synthase family protein [uncultured Jannaschia sp.]|uniref:squalene/phytoene synthase family protein n=1 Tax=uncultured Jannaschia sp. TaxID=293347 RepID=UPI0026328B56|nr:squalene/phytoene synthase family protein [uncultured Jannaschia sp.]